MFMAYGQRENQLPIKSASAATDTIRIVKDNQSALMLRSVLQGAIYDTLDAHTDTLHALRADIDAGGSSLLLDSINVHRVEIDNLHDSIAAHNTEIDANLDSIAVHRIEIDANLDSIADHRTEINANTSTGSTNGTNISTNSVFISVNTAKTTNATHTGDVEGSGALTIAVDAVDIPMLSASGTASSSTYLRGDNSWGTPAGGGSSDSSWTSITVDTIAENTTDGGVYIDGIQIKDHDLYYYVPGSLSNNIRLGTSATTFYRNLGPNTSTLDIGFGGTPWRAIYGLTSYIGSGATNYIDKDGSNNMTFTDAVTGTKTLAELAASGTNYWSRTGSRVSLANSGDSILLAAHTEILAFGDISNYLWAPTSSSIDIRISGSSIMRWTSTGIYPYRSFIPGSGSIDLGSSTYDWQDLYLSRAIIQVPISAALTDGAPTDAQIDTATGATPSSAGSGWKRLILDSNGTELMYIIISDGTNWQYTAMTKAL